MDLIVSHPYTPYAVIGLVGLITVILIVMGIRSWKSSRREDKREVELRLQVSRKAAQAVPRYEDTDPNLTVSGEFAVIQMMDELARTGGYAEAEKWARSAMESHPESVNVPVKLAEIYYRSGQDHRYVALVKEIADSALSVPESAWRSLMEMGRELVPDDPLFRAELERLGGGPAAGTAGLKKKS